MQFKQALLDNLEELYTQTSQELAAASARVHNCGSCTQCCHADVLSSHRVGEIEFALVADRVNQETADRFRDFIERKVHQDGELVYRRCPNLSESTGCKIYEVRPFSCRIFGHVREEGTRLPDDCVFTGDERIIQKRDYYREIPGSAQLRVLWREFQLLVALPAGPVAGPISLVPVLEEHSYINQDDPLDRTLEHVALQRYDEALAELLALDPHSETPARTELWGMTLASLGRHPEALAKYQLLLQAVPPRADLLYQAGCSAFLCGDAGQAERYWKKSCALSPCYAPTLGMLGYLNTILNHWSEAHNYFSRALEQDRENPFFHLRLGEVLIHTGELPLARIHLDHALLHPSTRSQAEICLTALSTA